MKPAEVTRAVAAAVSTVSALGLRADDAVVLHNSNRLAVRLQPCDVLARVAPAAHQEGAEFEVEVARRLAEADAPVAELEPRVEPRVYSRDAFAVTLWTYYEPLQSADLAPGEYAEALKRLHTGMRKIELAAPHFIDRVAEAQRLVDDPVESPELADADRELLSGTLRNLTRAILDLGATEQLLHGEPHSGNMLRTKDGLLFMDLETCCRGPVEFDIAHCSNLNFTRGRLPSYVDRDTSSDVGERYEGADQEMVRTCWVLMLAMVAAWRWDRRDEFPDGRRMGVEFVEEIRRAVDR
jgi:hypothetical protein